MSDETQGFGYGQGTPDDSAEDINIIDFTAKQRIEQLNIMKLVKVIAVHPGDGMPPAGGTVDVQLLVSQVDGNGYAVNHGTVYGLPYYRMQAGAWAVVLDPAVGDYGYIVCADRDSSSVIANPGQAKPGSFRRYDVADGVYVGGIASMNSVPAATLWLKSDGTWVISDKPGNTLKGDSNGITATPVSGKAFNVSGPIIATGTITGSDFSDGTVTSYKIHTHGGVTTGSSQTLGPTGGT